MARDDISLHLALDEIDVPSGHREVNKDAVKRLADSIDEIGLRHPITVRRKAENRYLLVAGLHRLEAFKKLERDYIPATVVVMTKDEARMWEISENLHRAELTKLERDEQVAEWIEIKDRVSRQSAAKPQGGRPEGGVRAAARDLGLEETDARRSMKVASLSDEAKDVAVETGMDENRSVLLAAAKEKEPEKQTAIIRDFAARKTAQASKVEADVKVRAAREVAEIIAEYVPGDAWDGIKANLYAAGAANIANALTNITGQSIMDGRYS